jgi:hypothetical protein
VVGELHLELVGGPLDGAERCVQSVCDCCGKDVAPGTVVSERLGPLLVRYTVNSNRCYAYFKDARRVA